MNPGTRRNAERTGQRKVTKLSAAARTIEGVRHVDIDLMQYCPSCKRPEAFFEVKSSPVSSWEWEQTRRLATSFGCVAVLVVEPWYGDIGTSVYDPSVGVVEGVTWAGDETGLLRVLEAARDRHECARIEPVVLFYRSGCISEVFPDYDFSPLLSVLVVS